MSEYPEHERLQAIIDDRDTVQHFLDWLLDEKGLTLAFYGEDNGFGDISREHKLFPAHANDTRLTPREDAYSGGLRERLLALYFDIDPRKLSKEKDQMLRDIRSANA